MVRVRPEQRLAEIANASARVFRERGYRRAKMADVARELGVSPGALYRYVESKAALFHLVVGRAGRPDTPAPAPSLPLPTPAPGATLTLLQERLEAGVRIESLDAALARRGVRDAAAELEGIVREMYERFDRGREAGNFIERSALEFPELARLWFGEVRHRFFERVARYVSSRMESGHFRALPDPAIAARLVIESVVFFARHRHGDPFETMDDDAARETVVRFVLHALLPDR